MSIIFRTAVFVAAAALAGRAFASPPCGTTITTNTTLDADVSNCSEGLTVDGSDGVVLDLAGFTISCDSNAVAGRIGVRVLDNKGATVIKNGSIRNCRAGVVGGGKTSVVNVTVRDSFNGFLLESDGGGSITGSAAIDNLDTGIALGAKYSASGCSAIGNGSYGFTGGKKLVGCQAIDNDSDGFFNASDLASTFKDNVATDNDGVGFYVTGRAKLSGNSAVRNAGGFTVGSDSKLSKNVAVANGSVGFDISGSGVKLSHNASRGNGTGIVLNGSGHVLKGNVVGSNDGNGIEASGSGHAISGNSAFSNDGNDLLDQNGDCTANNWSGNSFGTRSPACLQ